MPANLKTQILNSVEEQLRDLQPGLEKQVEIAAILAELRRLQQLLALRNDNSLNQLLENGQNGVIDQVIEIQSGAKGLLNFGKVLVDLYALQQTLGTKIQTWLNAKTITLTEKEKLEAILLGIITRTRQLLNYRPDVGAIMDDLTAIKSLRGGPADVVSFHDFHVLQMAFKSVWLHAFDESLKGLAKDLYEETVHVYDSAGLTLPPLDAIQDISQLQQFLKTVKSTISQSSFGDAPAEVLQVFPGAAAVWNLLSSIQGFIVYGAALVVLNPDSSEKEKERHKRIGLEVLASPDGPSGRLSRLLFEINRALNEPYAFDVFAPDSYNFGLMITYRQKWEPGEYQAGDLTATIPLAPGESRKFSKKRVVKKTRAEKEIEKSMSSRSLQASEISRAESEIMQKATTATNFKLTAHGAFNIGIGTIDSTSEFGINQDQQSALSKKEFHEATVKAAEEYRLERSLEVDTTAIVETEETISGEISNPNNEITVTYLFYELQRRYKIREFLYRVRPVILVAQDVPAPHHINESWLIQYQWIIGRVLLDDSLRPALDYLTSGFAGDEVAIEVIKANWEMQATLVKSLEGQVKSQLMMRDALREALVLTAQEKSLREASEMPLGMKILTLGSVPDPEEKAAEMMEANRKAAETRLQYVEQAVADAQNKLKQATSSFEQATKEYAAAIQNQHARHVAIDQLRVHVKQNILYYMQAIWDHEPPDQRFFRLYNKRMICPEPQPGCNPIIIDEDIPPRGDGGGKSLSIGISGCPPGTIGGRKHDLIEVADLDNPLGYKGNYIIFPLKDECYLTTYMLTTFVDNYLGVRDPDGSDDFDAEDFDRRWKAAANDQQERDKLRKELIKYITAVRRSTDEIIIPTGQLFIEALPGSHPLLEDFKLLHRFEDVRKVKAEVRHAELENLRLASRLSAGQTKTALLEDPDIEKKIVVEGNASVVVNPK
jgi:hypothetical protein